MAKSAGLGQDVLPLPSGGGTMKPIDESFKTDLGTGTGSYNIPLKLPKGVNDFTPKLALKYSTGKGNGPFGLGWSLESMGIVRGTDRGMPLFSDTKDVFLFEGRELVHMGINVYRPLMENEFSIIKKIGDGWEVRTKNGMLIKLGTTADSKIIVNDQSVEKTFGWFISEMLDNNGNSIRYSYEKNGGNIFLKQIDYSIYSVQFNYEDRPDSFSSFRTGFELRTSWRCTSIDINLLQPALDPIKSYRLNYTQAPYSKISLLTKATLVALHKENNVVEEIPFPAITFDYNRFDPSNKKLKSFSHAGSSPPPSLLGSDVSLLDFEGTGLPGIIEMANGVARFWPNKGDLRWGQPYALKNIPLHADLSDDMLLFADMEGNGTADLMIGSQQAGGYFPNLPGGDWGRKISYKQSPNVPLGNQQTRLLDLDGDNRVDMLYSDGESYHYYFNKGEKGWDERPLVVKRKFNDEHEPEVNLNDSHIRMGDVVGDGRTHMMQIHSERFLYWPNLGNGKWGSVKRMTNAPRLPRNYDPARLFLADIDGSGAVDMVYVDYDHISCWINQSGNSFSDEIVIKGTPPVITTGIAIADMKGMGTNGILWSYHDSLRNTVAYRYLDLCGGRKPGLLTSITSNTGVTTKIEHGSSIEYQNDKTDPRLAGANYFLPFPIPVVKKFTIHDPSTNVTSISHLKYFNGHFDGKARQFLGFAKAERIDEGDDTVPANRTVCYFTNTDVTLKGLPYLTEIYGEDNTPEKTLPFKSEENEYQAMEVADAPDGQQVKYICRKSLTNKTFERTNEWNEVRQTFKYDAVGNVIEEVKESKWKTFNGGIDQQKQIKTSEFAKNEAKWLMSFKSREIVKDGAGKILSATIWFYDGPDFTGLPAGQVEKGNILRERQLAMTQNAFAAVYGAVPPDLASLGYVQDNDAVLGQAFFIDRYKQKLDSFGNPVERKNPLGLTTIITYDNFHILPVKIVFSNGLGIDLLYEYKYGSVLYFKDQADVELRYVYDKAGQLVAVKRHDDPDDKPYLQYQYEHVGVRSQTTLTRAEKAGTQHKRVEYLDGVGEKLMVRAEAEDNKIAVTGHKACNAKGLTAKEFQPYFSNAITFSTADQPHMDVFTSYSYDAIGRSINRVDWDGNVYKTEFKLSSRSFYDPLDLKNVPNNNNFNTPKTEWIDAEDKLVTIIERKKNSEYVTRYTYDAAGNRVEIIINGSTFAENVFDNLNRRIRSVYRDAGTFTYLYDAMGNLVERKDGKGDVVFNKYDGLSRLTTVKYGGSNGSIVEEYQYDTGDPGELHTKGKLMKVKGGFGEVKFSYSTCGCLKSKTRTYPGLANPLKVEYDQDNLKRYKKIKYPDGFEASILYNHGGLIDSIPGVIDKVEYGLTGRKTKVRYKNGVVTEYKYFDGNQWLKSIKIISPDGTVKYQHLSYEYNETGHITKITDNSTLPGHLTDTRTFLYDEFDQLSRSMGTNQQGNYVHNYEYDDMTNIARYPEQFGTDHTLHGDAQHPLQITGITNQPAMLYKYDSAGNITETPDSTMQYDARNQLVKVTHKNGTVLEYFYDHLGSRVLTKRTVNGVTESIFNFDDIYVIEGNTITKFVFDESSQVAMIRQDNSGAVFHKDHLGSHIAETDLTTGAILNEQHYYAFGKMSVGLASSSLGFSGKKHDAVTDLVFFGGRYYVPSLGIFLTPDPYFLEQQPDKFFTVPRSLHLYGYVLNNPVNMIDPFGLWFGIDDLIAAGIGFVAGVAGYIINWAVSGGDFSFSEMLYSGLVGAVSLWFGYNTFGLGFAIFSGIAMVAGPAINGGLDKASMGDSFGERFLGFLSFAIKFARSPITSSVGLIIGGFGTGFGLWNDVEWFKGGVIAFEYDPSGAGFSAVTLGATVNIWTGSTSSPSFEHELYHSRQYTVLGDWFIPGWLVGGVYGMISGAIAGSSDWGSCFYSANPSKGYGNPLEAGAHAVDRGGGCS